MKRKLLIATAIAMLVGASAAYAALNTYTATDTFSPSKAGSVAKPSPIGHTQVLGAANTDPTKVAAPLVDLKDKIYGLTSNPKPFPTCSVTTITTGPKFDAACPKGSQVATGQVQSILGPPTLAKPGTNCNPQLHVYNAGKGKLWFFFTTRSGTDCNGLTTGATAPYPGTIKQQGKYLVTDVPLPPDISTKVAGHNNLYGSLITETIQWKKLTTKVKGKTVGFESSVACLHGKRPYSQSFTATNGSGVTETKTVSGSAKC